MPPRTAARPSIRQRYPRSDTTVAELELGQLLVGAAAAACEKPVDHHLGSGSHDVDAQIGSRRRKSNQSWLFLPRLRLNQDPKGHQMCNEYKGSVKRIDIPKRAQVEALNVQLHDAAQSV